MAQKPRQRGTEELHLLMYEKLLMPRSINEGGLLLLFQILYYIC